MVAQPITKSQISGSSTYRNQQPSRQEDMQGPWCSDTNPNITRSSSGQVDRSLPALPLRSVTVNQPLC